MYSRMTYYVLQSAGLNGILLMVFLGAAPERVGSLEYFVGVGICCFAALLITPGVFDRWATSLLHTCVLNAGGIALTVYALGSIRGGWLEGIEWPVDWFEATSMHNGLILLSGLVLLAISGFICFSWHCEKA